MTTAAEPPAARDIAAGGESIRAALVYPGTIRKNGGSYLITVPREYLEKMGLDVGDDVDVRLTIPPSRDVPSAQSKEADE